MATKKEKEQSSWDDFDSDNLLGVKSTHNEEEEAEEEEEQEEEETEEDESKKKKSKKVKAKSEEEESEEDDTEEEEEETPKKKKKVVKAEEESEEESEEEESEETEEESEEEEETKEADPSKFFEEVEKITGIEVEVDYGDVDPLSPQGVALREKAVMESAVDGFLEEIETKFPAAFKALQHAHNGGDIAELFRTTTSRDYSKVELTDKDQPLAKEILREYYQNKGIKNVKRIETFIQTAEDSEEGLIAEAKSALEELKAEQAEKADEALETQKVKAEDQKKRDRIMVSAVDEVLESGKLGTFKLAGRQEVAEFKNFALKGLRRVEGGKYEFATPVDSNNLEKLLQYQYFQFKKGDLSKLIQIKAATQNAEKLRLRLKSEGTKKKGSGTESSSSDKKTSLQDYIV